jgi:superfamily I DNA/RNA helicase
VFTWFGFVDAYLKEHQQALDFSQMSNDKDFWIKAQEKILEFEVPEHWKFDTVIIDEGQDFESIWWDLLRELFLKEVNSAKVLWMQDSDQNLRQINWSPSEFSVVLHARKNYRSPFGIATYIKQNFPFDFDIGNEFHGGGVEEVSHENDQDLVAKVESEIRKLLKEGFSTDDIVILSCGGAGKSAFNIADTIAGLRLKNTKMNIPQRAGRCIPKGSFYLKQLIGLKVSRQPLFFSLIPIFLKAKSLNIDRCKRLWG